MLQRSSEADNVPPTLPQGRLLQWSVLIWVSSRRVLQGSAVLTVVLQGSAVSHLLVTSMDAGNTDTSSVSTDRDTLLCGDRHIYRSIDKLDIVLASWETQF
ncbi:unnamed protein product [Pleuronectes platessa]|uniref:Uncharacterized protein n=1 Tax=Pleuronectes platessa TaxID=8262 RepID=A0A9N7W109_PLEPL|nr:unnamed protein product [Pleuronectes platessa]